MINGPLFSVIIPTYNNGLTLSRAIESVLAQTYPAHEVIVVDDGSTDNTRSVAEAFGNRIIYLYKNNEGVSVARNTGALLATGDWLAFLDADDCYYSNRLESHANLLTECSDLDFMLGDQEMKDQDGNYLGRMIQSCSAGQRLLSRRPHTDAIIIEREDFGELIADGFAEIRTLSVPRKTFVELKGFPIGVRIGEDIHFIIRLCACSKRAGVVMYVLATYYLYQGSVLRQNIVSAQEQYVQTLIEVERHIQPPTPIIISGLRRKIRSARLNLAYAYLRSTRKFDAICAVFPSLLTIPSIQSLRDLFSVIRGFPR